MLKMTMNKAATQSDERMKERGGRRGEKEGGEKRRRGR